MDIYNSGFIITIYDNGYCIWDDYNKVRWTFGIAEEDFYVGF